MIKQVGIWVAIAAAWGIAFAAKEAFGISDYWMWLAVLAIVGIFITTSVEGRLARLEARVVHTDYSGVIKLLEGERHIPRHQQPESLAAGGALKSFITPAHEMLFDDFGWFAAVLNKNVSDPWAIEELNDTNVRGLESPEVGRRYRVWYNACEVGTMQVTAAGFSVLDPEEFAKNRRARVDIQLRYLRFIQYEDAHSLISQVALFTQRFDFENGDLSRDKASAEAAHVLAGYLWEAVREPELDPYFEYAVEGPYDLLRHAVEHWRSHGVDPFERWGGDRPKE